jgi:hypothetical protein
MHFGFALAGNFSLIPKFHLGTSTNSPLFRLSSSISAQDLFSLKTPIISETVNWYLRIDFFFNAIEVNDAISEALDT